MAGALWLFACYGSRASALSIWWLLPQFLKNLKKLWFFYSKRAPSPSKTEVLHEKNVIFYSKKPPSLAKNSSCALIIFLFIFLLFFSFYFFFRFFFLDRKKMGFFLIENQKTEVLHEKLKFVLPMGILKKKIPTPNFTKFLNP